MSSLGWALLASSLWMWLLWGVQLRSGDAGIVDFGWALAIAVLASAAAWLGGGSALQRGLAGGLGLLWGGRLTWYLLRDRVLAPGEDGRYAYLRAHWGAAADRHFCWFFQIQALLALLFAMPFALLAEDPRQELAAVQVVGLLLILAAGLGEGWADLQLARFRAEPRHAGQVCRVGLWRFCRHPNYFCAWLVWCGIALVCWPAPRGGWAIGAPLLLYLFVTRISGIPYTEAQALRRRGAAYRRYQQETNAFFPGPVRRLP